MHSNARRLPMSTNSYAVLQYYELRQWLTLSPPSSYQKVQIGAFQYCISKKQAHLKRQRKKYSKLKPIKSKVTLTNSLSL